MIAGRLFFPVIATALLAACGKPSPQLPSPVVTTPADLAEHTREFRREVIEVTDGVHVAVGFGLANSILLEGDDGVVIVDTMETLEEAADVRQAFAAITDKPVAAIIFTHNHADHVFGAAAFADGRAIPVYAHATTSYYIQRVVNVVRAVLTRRSGRMFGLGLEGPALENAGIGPWLGLDVDSRIETLWPTVTFADRLETEIAGIRMVLVHAPGETRDQLFVWLPDKKVLLPGDNFYRAFPNLYTIRGTPNRDLTQWVDSLDAMRRLKPRYLVPSHTRPLEGEENIYGVLTDYRDAIQFVHDQTVRGMNAGLTPDELVEVVRLPHHLATSPFLQEFYGKVAWSVRSVFEGYIGWFDGNPTTLLPLSPDERARRLSTLAGGDAELVESAAAAAADGDHRWVLELTDAALRIDPALQTARDLRAASLTALGEAQSNPNARHYYLVSAMEIGAGFDPSVNVTPTENMLHSLPLESMFDSMAVNLDPARTGDLERVVNFHFPDGGENWSIWLRRGVAEIQPYHQPDADIIVTLDSRLWRDILAGNRSPLAAFAKGDIGIEGGKLDLVEFLGYFKAAR